MNLPPARPTPAQLGGWLADGREALALAASPLRLKGVIARGQATPAQGRRLVLGLIDSTATRLASLSAWLAAHAESGKATLAAWFASFAGTMAPALFAAAMAALGTPDLAPADVASAGSRVARQYAYLARFRDQIRDGSQPVWMAAASPAGPGSNGGGPPSLLFLGGRPETPARLPSPGFLGRSRMYADAAWGLAEGVLRDKMTRDGYSIERRHLGGAEKHCSECPHEAALGWRPIGTLKAIGETSCRSRCRCSFSYSHDSIIFAVTSALISSLP